MQVFNLLDMSKVPLPDSITELDYEQKYTELKQRLLTKYPQYADALTLESEPLAVMLEMMSYQALLFDGKLNDAIKNNMLATATGKDLDAIAARYNLARQPINEGNGFKENDDQFRRRIQMVFEGLNTAGSKQAYQYHTLSADRRVKDVYITSPAPCDIQITVLSHEKSGIPSEDLLTKLNHFFGLLPDGSGPSEKSSRVRPLGDRVNISSPQVKPFEIEVEINIAPGPAASVVETTVKKSLEQYIKQQFLLGKEISHMGLFSAINQPGVESGKIISPGTNIQVQGNEVALCQGITIYTSIVTGE